MSLPSRIPIRSRLPRDLAWGGAAAGDTELDTIVSVDRKGNVVSPCGMCRELISDYAPACRVIVPNRLGVEVVTITELLPNKYRRRWRDEDALPDG